MPATKLDKFIKAYKEDHKSWDELMKLIDELPQTPKGHATASLCEALMYEWMLRETGLRAEWWFPLYRPDVALKELKELAGDEAKVAITSMLFWGRSIQDCWTVWQVMPDKTCAFAKAFHQVLLAIKHGQLEVGEGVGFYRINPWNDRVTHSLKPKAPGGGQDLAASWHSYSDLPGS